MAEYIWGKNIYLNYAKQKNCKNAKKAIKTRVIPGFVGVKIIVLLPVQNSPTDKNKCPVQVKKNVMTLKKGGKDNRNDDGECSNTFNSREYRRFGIAEKG